MAPRRCDFQAPLGQRLPPHLAEVIAGGTEGCRCRPSVHPEMIALLAPRQHLDGLGQRRDTIHGQAVHFRGFAGRPGREDAAAEPFFPRFQRHGKHPVHGPDPAVQGQLAHDQEFVAVDQRHLPGSGQHAQGDGQVVG